MPSKRLETRRVAKTWGRRHLWPGFADAAPDEEPVGEIWFQDEADDAPELLVKYLFTSEKLSIQVHPDDAAAQAAGYPRGKDEAWVILAAELDSRIAIGTKQPVDPSTLRAAAFDGSIEDLVDWRPVSAGDVFYSPAGTVHAIGAGITLVEVQQNVDLTYRLYDYGRPRELHVDAGVKVSDARPFIPTFAPKQVTPGRTILAEGGKFVLERWSLDGTFNIVMPRGTPGWLVAIASAGTIDAAAWRTGETWLINDMARLSAGPGSELLFAYPLVEHAHGLLA